MSSIIPRIARSVGLAKPKPRFEFTPRQMAVLQTTSQVILAAAILAGIITISAVAPNLFLVLDKMPWSKKTFGPKRRSRDYIDKQEKKIRKSFYYLKSKGYIELLPLGEDFLMKVTEKGRKLEKRMKFSDLQIKRARVWDGHWWLVAADIPTPYKHLADDLRQKAKDMKFYLLQRTLWFYPFDPRDEMDFITKYLHLDRFVTVMRVNHLHPDDERKMRKFFHKEGII